MRFNDGAFAGLGSCFGGHTQKSCGCAISVVCAPQAGSSLFIMVGIQRLDFADDLDAGNHFPGVDR
jgi:hypothetical protein